MFHFKALQERKPQSIHSDYHSIIHILHGDWHRLTKLRKHTYIGTFIFVILARKPHLPPGKWWFIRQQECEWLYSLLYPPTPFLYLPRKSYLPSKSYFQQKWKTIITKYVCACKMHHMCSKLHGLLLIFVVLRN